MEDIGGVLDWRGFAALAIEGVLEVVGLVRGRPANARGALNLEISDSKVE